jgi:hypothetical protein
MIVHLDILYQTRHLIVERKEKSARRIKKRIVVG